MDFTPIDIDFVTRFAYIGPGGGMALLGPLLAVLAAILGAIAMIALWPVRMLLRRLRAGRHAAALRTPADLAK